MSENSIYDFEDFGSEVDAPPSVEIVLTGKHEPKLPVPVKPVILTRGSGQVTAAQQKRSEQIRDFCHQREITDICHFTRIENLKGIITEGLISRSELEKRPAGSRPIFTDELRRDGHTDASCLSISFPNYKMFYRKRRESNDDNLWAVIIYDYSAISRLNCAFTVHNAAAGARSQIDLRTRNNVDSLAEAFGDFGQIQRNKLGIPDNYPTNPQAEVLAFEKIPANYIKQVVFYNKNMADQWISENSSVFPLNRYFYGGRVFKYRMDYDHWKKEQF